VYVSVYDANGDTVVQDAPYGVPPLAHWQERLPVTVEGGSVEFLVQDPCWNDDNLYAVVFPYTSTIDDISGDPRYQTPSLLATPGLIFGKKTASTRTDASRQEDRCHTRARCAIVSAPAHRADARERG
jgi:hypothetical protein